MKTRGRPPHEPTAATKRKVANCKGGGWTQEEIAELLDIDCDTLRKHYRRELTVGARQAREEVLDAVMRAAKDGSMAAARLYLQGTAKPEPLPQPTDASLEIVSMPSQATGVKAQRNENAKTAQQGTEWATLLPSSVQ
jgi:hypothetical protein